MAADDGDLYEFVSDTGELGSPVLVHALPGFVDAGSAVRLMTEHLLATRPHREIARFDHDVLVDYRGGRPALVFAEDHYEQYEAPTITLHAVEDAAGTPFLLLTGREPDFQWDRFAAAVSELIERLGVRLTIGTLAIPMTVPHTRPVTVTGHGTRKGLVPADGNLFSGKIKVPASIGAMLEVRLGEAGKDAGGFAVHVPHYVATSDYPDAAVTLIERLCAATGLTLPTTELADAAKESRALIDGQVAESSEVKAVVAELEQQYDAIVGSRSITSGSSLADAGPLPSAEQIGAEFERFLSGLEDGR